MSCTGTMYTREGIPPESHKVFMEETGGKGRCLLTRRVEVMLLVSYYIVYILALYILCILCKSTYTYVFCIVCYGISNYSLEVESREEKEKVIENIITSSSFSSLDVYLWIDVRIESL